MRTLAMEERIEECSRVNKVYRIRTKTFSSRAGVRNCDTVIGAGGAWRTRG